MNAPTTSRILSGLHCFFCVGRHLSFSKAAEELCLTQGAVSHRIRTLEAELGLALFHRFTRRIGFTEEGARLYAALGRTMGEIEAELEAICSQELYGSLHVCAPPSFAGCWLLPRIASFQERYPGISLHVRCRTELADFENELVHLAVHYGATRQPGLYVMPLMEETIFPVCAPEYAVAHALNGHPERLDACTLLHDAQAWPNSQYFSEWKSWLDKAGFPNFQFRRTYTFDRSELALLVATQGGGVAIGRSRLVGDRLQSGSLVMPFETVVPAPQVYSIVMPPEHVKVARIAAFCTWMREQVLAESFSGSVPA